MDRLTTYHCGVAVIKDKALLSEAMARLAAYEDTGLTPAEIRDGKLLTGWIPVEERMPVTDDGYAHIMVSMDDGFVCTTDYTNKDGFELWADSGEVVAWIPLPEPYKPED